MAKITHFGFACDLAYNVANIFFELRFLIVLRLCTCFAFVSALQLGSSSSSLQQFVPATTCSPYQQGRDGSKFCGGWSSTICDDDDFCCGLNDSECCNVNRDVKNMFGEAVAFVVFVMLVCIPIYCCYRCCRRTSQPGFVYSPADTRPVTVAVPPQQGQVPYPSVMPYPQQTPYPTQQPTNPYFGGPPPPYHVVQGNFQNASAPTL